MRYRCARLAVALCCLLPTNGVAAETVSELRYGTTLFYFFQRDYFSALTEVSVARELGQLGNHADNAELLSAGMQLSWGMERRAEQLFSRLLATSDKPDNRDRAWFSLARLAWQRGETDRAQTLLARVTPNPEEPLAAEVAYLNAALQLRKGDLRRARDQMAAIPANSPWLPYLYHNAGAALAASGEWQSAAAHFRQVGELDLRSPEAMSMRDRAYTASGYAWMAAEEYGHAADDFSRVRLHAPLSERALLGYGWAATRQQDFEAALSPWQELSRRDGLTPSIREVLLALPYAFEQLGRPGAAMTGYQKAADTYQRGLAHLQNVIDNFSPDDLRELLGLRSAGYDTSVFHAEIQPNGPHAHWLIQLLASHRFQSAASELRDLYQLEHRLSNVREKLGVLDQANAEQGDTWAGVIGGGRQLQLAQRSLALTERAGRLRKTLARAEQSADSRALSGSAQKNLWVRLESAYRLNTRLGTTPEREHLLRLYQGLLRWEDSENWSANLWSHKRELRAVEAQLALSNEASTRLDTVVTQRQHDSFAPRIAELRGRTQLRHADLERVLSRSEQHVHRQVVAELTGQFQQLNRALAQSKLAMARLHDPRGGGSRP